MNPSGWRALLAGSPREVLARLVTGDPLDLRRLVADRLRSDALLLDADRIRLRAIARIARASHRYRGRPDLRRWTDTLVAQAIEECVREGSERPAAASAGDPGENDAIESLSRPLGLDPTAMRSACSSFNRLPWAERTTFLELVVRGRSIDELAREHGESASRVARRARRALDTLLGPLASAPAEHASESEARGTPGSDTQWKAPS